MLDLLDVAELYSRQNHSTSLYIGMFLASPTACTSILHSVQNLNFPSIQMVTHRLNLKVYNFLANLARTAVDDRHAQISVECVELFWHVCVISESRKGGLFWMSNYPSFVTTDFNNTVVSCICQFWLYVKPVFIVFSFCLLVLPAWDPEAKTAPQSPKCTKESLPHQLMNTLCLLL